METAVQKPAEPNSSADTLVKETITYFHTHSFSFLIWGWALFSASVLHYAILQLGDHQLPFNASAAWPASIIAAALISVLKTINTKGASAAPAYPAKVLSGMWKGFAGPVIIALMLGSVNGWDLAFPFLIAAFGWGLISTGVIIQFKPLIYGGSSTFIFAVLAMYVSADLQLLMITGAVTFGYLLPGYMMVFNPNYSRKGVFSSSNK